MTVSEILTPSPWIDVDAAALAALHAAVSDQDAVLRQLQGDAVAAVSRGMQIVTGGGRAAKVKPSANGPIFKSYTDMLAALGGEENVRAIATAEPALQSALDGLERRTVGLAQAAVLFSQTGRLRADVPTQANVDAFYGWLAEPVENPPASVLGYLRAQLAVE